jgi:hypothetical protein
MTCRVLGCGRSGLLTLGVGDWHGQVFEISLAGL